MSELTPTPEELLENFTFEIGPSNMLPTPIDPTLSNEGEAADAKATGDAIAGVIGNLRVNTRGAVNNAITVYATDIPMSSEAGANTVADAIDAAGNRDANSIYYDPNNLVTIKAAIDDIRAEIDTELSNEEIDELFDEVFGGE